MSFFLRQVTFYLHYSRAKSAKATWDLVGFLCPDQLSCDNVHFSKGSPIVNDCEDLLQ